MQAFNVLLKPIFAILVTTVLIFSFGLHAVQISHTHPGHSDHGHGEQTSVAFSVLGEFMHASEKKFLFLIASAVLSVPFLYTHWLVLVRILNTSVLVILRRRRELISILTNHIKLFFARGILNPKLH